MNENEWDDPITAFLNPKWVGFLRRISPGLAGLALILGVLALTGWVKDVAVIDRLSKADLAMKPPAAVGVILLAASQILACGPRDRLDGRFPHAIPRLAAALALIPFLMGVLTVIQYVASVPLIFDSVLIHGQWLIHGPGVTGHSSLMAPTSVACLILLSSAVAGCSSQSRRGLTFSHATATVAAVLAAFSIIGYCFGVAGLLGFGFRDRMEIFTAIAFLLLALAVLCARPDHDLLAILASEGPGGYVARRLVPVSIALPFVLGALRVWGEHGGLYASDLGTAAFTIFNIVLLATIVWWTARLLQRIEIRRVRVDAERNRLAIEGRLRDQFQSMLSHDLRNPLSVARMSSEMIGRLVPAGTPAASFAERAQAALNRTDRMIEDLLDSSRIKAGQPVVLRITRCEINAIIAEALEDLRLVHGSRFEFRPGPPVRGRWDRSALRRVIENLASNAVKYGLEDRPITVAIRGPFLGRIALSVHNEGGRISADQAEILFEPFQRAADAMLLGKKGWGIGLTVVKAVVEAHRGRVSVSSDEVAGTTFTLELPVDAGIGSIPGGEGRPASAAS